MTSQCFDLFSVLWYCWLGSRKGIRPVTSAAAAVRNTVIVTGGMQLWSCRTKQPMQPSQYSWSVLAVLWQHAVPRQEHRYPSVLWCHWFASRKGISCTKCPVPTILKKKFTFGRRGLNCSNSGEKLLVKPKVKVIAAAAAAAAACRLPIEGRYRACTESPSAVLKCFLGNLRGILPDLK